MSMPFELLRARRQLLRDIERQRQLFADDVIRTRVNAAQVRQSIVHTITSPVALGATALLGFAATRKLLAKRDPAEQPVASEAKPSTARLLITPLLIQLLAPTLSAWISGHLMPLLQRLDGTPDDFTNTPPA